MQSYRCILCLHKTLLELSKPQIFGWLVIFLVGGKRNPALPPSRVFSTLSSRSLDVALTIVQTCPMLLTSFVKLFIKNVQHL